MTDPAPLVGPGAGVLADRPVLDLATYVAGGGGSGLAAALERTPEAVIAEVSSAGLRGRGGAGFPTGTKWASVVQTAAETGSPPSLAVNGAEGEPGTAKDRALMVADPYLLLEGALIALHALGAAGAWVGIKGSFTAFERVTRALDEVQAAGWTGADRVHLVAGPDEYLFGEEKALLEVVEGKLPFPRILPPYMTGLWGTVQQPNPTAVNNSETLCHVTQILAGGADAFRRRGTAEAPGTMVFTVVGDVSAPGVYELPLGTALRTLLVDIAGADESLKAVFSGVSNAVILPDLLDLPMDFDSFAEAGTGLGSGGFVVYGARHCMVRVAATIAHFLAVESCGQCPPCKLGTAAVAERLAAIDRGEGTANDLAAVRDRALDVTDQARCGLPLGTQALLATVAAFAEEFEAHLGRPCPSAMPAVVPKITDIQQAEGVVVYDPAYARKRGDWSFAEDGEEPPRSILNPDAPRA